MKNQFFTHCFFALFFIAFQMSYGQIYDSSFNYAAESMRLTPVPNSPEAQAFTKYGDTPVNMYTGTPNIQIPIYTHKGREFDLPISLTYDASGIKVEQLATQVGLGWNLNVGGRISRIVNGMPDDFHNTSYTSGPYQSLWDSTVNSGILAYDDISSSPSFDSYDDLIAYMYFLKKADDNEYDIQPDFFSFSALGNSDMFTIDVNSKTPKSLDSPRLKATITKAYGGANTPITKWVVTMDDGTIYTFEEEEVTRDVNLNDLGQPTLFGLRKEYNSSWLLTKIESANSKDVYEFTYTDLGFWGSNRTASSITGVTNVLSSVTTPTNNMGYSNTEYTIKQKVLSTITHNGDRIVAIDLLADRWDMTVDSAIEKINIYDQDTGNPTADLHKSFVFDYDYFRTSFVSAPPYNSGNTPDPLFVRLKLDGILIKDSNSALVKDYMFEYNDPYTMPSTTSQGQDYFGYNNGVTSNSVLYPTYNAPSIPSGDGANRNPNFNSTKKGLLNKITYPTGGHTTFDYESNYEQEATDNSTVWQVIASTELDYPLPSAFPPYDPNACNDNSTLVTPITDSDTFQVTQNQTDYKMVYDQTGTLGGTFTTEKRAILVKIASSTATLSWAQIYDNNCNVKAGVDVVWNLPFKQKTFPYSETITLDSGFYQLVLANPLSTFSNSFEVQEGVLVTNYTYNVKAGVRVKDIKDYIDATTLAFHKSYQYPSGTVISDPRYTYTSTQYSLDSGGYPVVSTILHRLSYASGTDKPHMGYAEVIETVEDALGSYSNGSTSHRFNTNNAGNYRTGVYTYFINGKETAKQYGVTYYLGKSSGSTVYDSQGVPVSSSLNSYYGKEYYFNTGIYTHIDESRNDLFPIPTENTGNGKYYISYLPYTKIPASAGSSLLGWASMGGVALMPPPECISEYQGTDGNDLCKPGIGRLIKQTSKAWGKAGNILTSSSSQYYDAATNIVSQLTNYTYYDEDVLTVVIPGEPAILVPGNYLLKDTETTNSKGETLKQEFLYADHVSSGAGGLKSSNMLAIPLESKIYKDGTLMSHKKTVYSGTLPSKIQTLKGGGTQSSPEDRLLFERFEDENLVQVKQVDGPTTAYIWGYDSRYVVAKVENTTYAEIENLTAFGSGSGFTITDKLTTTQENALRVISNVLVTTYEYDPMVGVSRITDPTGQTVTYHYDDFNRLEYVKDKNGKILSQNQYNYKN